MKYSGSRALRHYGGVTMVGQSARFPILVASLFVSAPAVAAECGPLQVITTLPMTPLGNPGNVVTVPATIGDKRPVKLLLDTGGAFSEISETIVNELNLPSRPSRVQMVNVAGQRTTQEVRLPSITLGRVRQEGPFFIVDPAPGGGTEPFDGILAPDFLLNVDLDLDFGGNKVNLVSPQHCAGKVVYWAAPAIAVVPIHIDANGHIRLTMMLDGKRVNAMLDTGATNTVLNLDVARKTFDVDTSAPDVQRVGELKGGYTADIYKRRFHTLAVDGITIQNPEIVLLPDMMSNKSDQRPIGSLIPDTDHRLQDLILGMSVLSKLHVYVAYKEAKVYITAANSDPPSPGFATPPAQP